MAKQSLIEAFNVKPRKLDAKMVKDYDIFPDKELLDSLRSKIIQDLVANIPIPRFAYVEQSFPRPVIEDIPAIAYDYVVNGKSAIEWIMERYAVTQDSKSLIVNDPNDWSKEHNKPRYILDLLLSVINLSVQSVEIINSLPKLTFDYIKPKN